jgi:capsular polysaccharide transport system permease protein
VKSDVISRIDNPALPVESRAVPVTDQPAAAGPRAAAASIAASREARRARRRRRRLLSLVAAVALPTALTAGYLYGFASDQYVTEFRFSIRRQMPVRATPTSTSGTLSGGNPMLAVVQDSETVVEYLKSRQVVQDIASRVDLDKVWGREDADYLSRMERDRPIEDKTRHWKTKVDPYFDMANGLVAVRVRAYSPADSLAVASAALDLSERLVNDMSRRAHADAVAHNQREVEIAEERLTRTQVELATFRNANAVLFPATSASVVASVEAKLRETLAETRAQYANQSAQGVVATSSQMRALRSQITALEEQIARVRSEITGTGKDAGHALATVIAGYTTLEVREKLAEKAYERALANLQEARSEALRQQVYVNAFVRPTLAERSTYPVRWRVLLEVALGSFVGWCLLMLIWQAVRDHAD